MVMTEWTDFNQGTYGRLGMKYYLPGQILLSRQKDITCFIAYKRAAAESFRFNVNPQLSFPGVGGRIVHQSVITLDTSQDTEKQEYLIFFLMTKKGNFHNDTNSEMNLETFCANE